MVVVLVLSGLNFQQELLKIISAEVNFHSRLVRITC